MVYRGLRHSPVAVYYGHRVKTQSHDGVLQTQGEDTIPRWCTTDRGLRHGPVVMYYGHRVKTQSHSGVLQTQGKDTVPRWCTTDIGLRQSRCDVLWTQD